MDFSLGAETRLLAVFSLFSAAKSSLD